MKSIIITVLILFNGLIYCQDQGIELPNHLGFFIYNRPKVQIIKHLKEIEKYSFENLTTSSKWWYHLTVSSCKLYLGRDSSLYHFYEAYKIKPEATCGSMSARHNHFLKVLEEEKATGIEDAYIKKIKKETGSIIFSWYLWDLPDFDEFAFIDSCNQLFPLVKVEPIDTTQISEIIRKRDQKDRGNIEKQQEFDQINRDFIDSLYLLKGTLNAFNEEEIYQFTMVAHHSEDCDWVYKWLERFIDHCNNGYKGKSMIGPLLDRMLHPKDGYCTKQDAQKRDYFIYMIKDKYPKFFESRQLDW